MDNFELSLVVLLSGLLVVFLVLILLTGLIKLYGTIVYNLSQKNKGKGGQNKPGAGMSAKAEKPAAAKAQAAVPVPVVEAGIPAEVVAAIAAAVYCVQGPSAAVRSVKRAPRQRPVWSTAGLMENTRPF